MSDLHRRPESGSAASSSLREGLPPGWEIAPLPLIAILNPVQPDSVPRDDDEVSFVPMAAVDAMSGRLVVESTRRWGEVKRGYTRFQEGDVLVAKITPCMENGKAAVARGLSKFVGAGSTEFHVLRPTQAVMDRLLLYYVLQEGFRKAARASMTGTAGQLRVPPAFMEGHELPLPPLAEQSRIVAALESYFTRLDDAVANLERVQRNLKRYRVSVFRAAVEGRLVPTEAELARAEGRDYEPAPVLLERILEERRRQWKEAGGRGKYVEPAVPDVGDLPQLPEGWCWASLDALTAYITSGSRGWAKYYATDGPIFIRAQDLKHDRTDLNSTARVRLPGGVEGTRTRVLAGDILVTITGANVTKTGYAPQEIGEAYVSQHVGLCRPVDANMTRYLHLWIVAPSGGRYRLERAAYGAGKPGLNLDNLRELPIPLPPSDEAVRIVNEADRLLSSADSLRSSSSDLGARVARLSQAVLKWAFEGRLVDQDPTDEPAAKLLDRIRAERDAASHPTRDKPARGRPPKPRKT